MPYNKKKRTDEEDILDENEAYFAPKGMTEGASTMLAVVMTIVYSVFIVAIAAGLAYFVISFANDMYAFVKDDTPVDIVIPQDATADDIADILAEAGVINHPEFMKLYAKLKHMTGNEDPEDDMKFTPGKYTVNGMMNYDELFLKFEARPTRTTIRLTIPEGYSVDEIIELFVSNGICSREEFVKAINEHDYSEDFPYLADIKFGEENPSRVYKLEGYLFPDTYDFYTDNTAPYYIYKLLARFDQMFSKTMREAAEKKNMTIDEVMIYASIIQREGFYVNDYEGISAVLHNRMDSPDFDKLECDSTTLYAFRLVTGTTAGSLSDRELYDTLIETFKLDALRTDFERWQSENPDATEEETEKQRGKLAEEYLFKIENPYNTYVAAGLTPGPICNPGADAISCAITPAVDDSETGMYYSKYYYFCTDVDNTVLYADTLENHKKNVALVLSHRGENN